MTILDQFPPTLEGHFAFQQALFHPVLRMTLRGCRIDHAQRDILRRDLIQLQFDRQAKLDYMAGHAVNANSPKQLMRFFYEDLKIPGVKHIKEDRLTTDSNALQEILNREPILGPFCQTIAELRSIGVFLSVFLGAPLDVDGRMRTEFAVAGPVTYRFSSRENAFGSGMNFQNIPQKEKEKLKGAHDYVSLPNIRSLFIPDPNQLFFDLDLDRADLQCVVWEADDHELRAALQMGVDLHIFNGCSVYGLKMPPLDELVETHPNYREHKKRFAAQRQLAKQAVHATNYGVGDRKLAVTIGITVHEASQFRSRWFAAHPGIKKWHERIELQAKTKGYITNPFGARFYVFGDLNLPELLAWGPQSTVAGVINRALYQIDQAEQAGQCPVQLLLQVHDSLGGQFPQEQEALVLASLQSLAAIPIPYPTSTLTIPVGIGTSSRSWGDC